MDAFNFIHFLKNPTALHQVTFQEINNLIEQYPFCQNLHYLALRKAQLEDHKDFVKKLELAATYSPNRQWLYKQLKEKPEPAALSDELVMSEPDQFELSQTEALPVLPEIVVDEVVEDLSPSTIYYHNEEPDFNQFEEDAIDPDISEDIDNLLEELEGATPAEGETPENHLEDEAPSETITDTDKHTESHTITSHSISDSDETPVEIAPTDELDLNLENPEDMKLPDYKDRRVIFMEDLVEEVSPMEDTPNEVDPVEVPNNTFTPAESEPFIEPETPIDSAAVSDSEREESANPDIPFEIYDARQLVENPTETMDDIPSEAEMPEADAEPEPEFEPESTNEYFEEEEEEVEEEKFWEAEEEELISEPNTQHLIHDSNEQLDQAASPTDAFENRLLAAIENEEDDFQKPEDDPEELEMKEKMKKEKKEKRKEEVKDITKENSDGRPGELEEKKPTSVAPMPKSAFKSWKKKKSVAIDLLKKEKKKKKKVKKEKQSSKVMQVTDLFKKEKKAKSKKKGKKKNSKKKITKEFAMESLLEHEDVISETLAEILAEQGSKKKAIKMYKRLVEMKPEKKKIYLNRIEELRK